MEVTFGADKDVLYNPSALDVTTDHTVIPHVTSADTESSTASVDIHNSKEGDTTALSAVQVARMVSPTPKTSVSKGECQRTGRVSGICLLAEKWSNFKARGAIRRL